jgi:hypothetical protein
MITLATLVRFVVYLIVIGSVVGLLVWLIDYVGLPQPFHKVAKVGVVVLGVLVVICLLLSLVGNPVIAF